MISGRRLPLHAAYPLGSNGGLIAPDDLAHSSGSLRADKAVEPTRSTNSTDNWRRSAESTAGLTWLSAAALSNRPTWPERGAELLEIVFRENRQNVQIDLLRLQNFVQGAQSAGVQLVRKASILRPVSHQSVAGSSRYAVLMHQADTVRRVSRALEAMAGNPDCFLSLFVADAICRATLCTVTHCAAGCWSAFRLSIP
jgi:hypothetical protein